MPSVIARPTIGRRGHAMIRTKNAMTGGVEAKVGEPAGNGEG